VTPESLGSRPHNRCLACHDISCETATALPRASRSASNPSRAGRSGAKTSRARSIAPGTRSHPCTRRSDATAGYRESNLVHIKRRQFIPSAARCQITKSLIRLTAPSRSIRNRHSPTHLSQYITDLGVRGYPTLLVALSEACFSQCRARERSLHTFRPQTEPHPSQDLYALWHQFARAPTLAGCLFEQACAKTQRCTHPSTRSPPSQAFNCLTQQITDFGIGCSLLSNLRSTVSSKTQRTQWKRLLSLCPLCSLWLLLFFACLPRALSREPHPITHSPTHPLCR
jgi:hypothetical protein